MNERKFEQRLREVLAQLSEERQQELLDFAEFLAARYPAKRETPSVQPIPRPERESVVKAIQRLAATYPMLDRGKMLNETSVLMSQHVIQGRDAIEVINELEVLFQRHYEAHASKPADDRK